MTLAELAEHIGAQLEGDPTCVISSPAPLDKAGLGQISFLHDPKYKKFLPDTQASAVILNPKDKVKTNANLLLLENPPLGYAKALEKLVSLPRPKPGIHPTAVVGEHCKISQTATIGPYVVIGDHVEIGENTVIDAHCAIGDHATLGENVRLYPNVTLYHTISIGDRTIIHGGAVIGADGFGQVNDKGKWIKIPQLGNVVIGNDVEIGANTTIDRGALEDTIISDGVKLDNLIQIAHNVHIGAHTLMAGCSAVAGSTHIGKHCTIGGGVVIGGHIHIADQVMLTGTTVIHASISDPGVYSSGVPSQPNQAWRRNAVRFLQLDDMARRLRKLEKNCT